MAARGSCQILNVLRKRSFVNTRLLFKARTLTTGTKDETVPNPNAVTRRHYHCCEIQKSKDGVTSVKSTNLIDSHVRQLGSLPGPNSDQLSDSEGPEEGDFDKYGISPAVQKKLRAKGITYLFPVQYETHSQTMEGWDVVVQARTGTGKTLSFGIPLVEKLQENQRKHRGRSPKAIILEPTRELANQVAQDLNDISDTLDVVCLYGGAAYKPQLQAIDKGLDIVIGTPGRVQDMINQGNLDLSEIEHVVLDEVDRMLDMGFADSVENIIRSCYEKDEKPQTMLYSATMPPWVFKIGKRYLKNNFRHLNLIGEETVKTSTTVEHLALRCIPSQIQSLLPDIIQVHCGQHGRAIVFCQTKKECDELASGSLHKLRAQVLHGDIAQAKRDTVIKAFKRGHHKVLITTDVASRGLDIPNVELVIQTSPPQDEDFYIHRSGRTGRAGKSGVSLLLFSPDDLRTVSQIERAAGVRFKKISAPTADQIIEASAHDVAKSLDKVLPETLEHFREPAQDLIDERGAEDALAAAMAVIAGATKIKSRSLLSNREDRGILFEIGEGRTIDGFLHCKVMGNNTVLGHFEQGYTTYVFKTVNDIRNQNIAYRILWKHMDEDLIPEVKDLNLLKDRTGVVFDIQSDLEEELESSWIDTETCSLEKATELPDIEHVDHRFKGTGKSSGQRRGEMSYRQYGRRNSDSYFDSRKSHFKHIDKPLYMDEEERFFQKRSGGFRTSRKDLDDFGFSRRSSFKANRNTSTRNRSQDSDDYDDYFFNKKS